MIQSMNRNSSMMVGRSKPAWKRDRTIAHFVSRRFTGAFRVAWAFRCAATATAKGLPPVPASQTGSGRLSSFTTGNRNRRSHPHREAANSRGRQAGSVSGDPAAQGAIPGDLREVLVGKGETPGPIDSRRRLRKEILHELPETGFQQGLPGRIGAARSGVRPFGDRAVFTAKQVSRPMGANQWEPIAAGTRKKGAVSDAQSPGTGCRDHERRKKPRTGTSA